MNTALLTPDLSDVATLRDWTTRNHYLPYTISREVGNPRKVEIISMPWWEAGHVRVLVRNPGDPTTLRQVLDPQLTITPLDRFNARLERMRRLMPADVATWAFTLGWEVEGTGGGCDALRQDDLWSYDGNGWWWITDVDGGQSPQSWGPVYLGRYDPDGEQVWGQQFDSIQQADAFVASEVR